ncbi:RNA-binding protein [Patescibacteria group bacterium]|nr:RNA-binding protein [Patescibacteria group bacterium]
MNKRIFVAGLPFSTTSDELKSLFAEFGTVVSAIVITDRESGKSKGFGFVEMEKDEETMNAISKLNDTEFGGRKLVVNEARPREEKPRSRGFGGGFSRGRGTFGQRREGGRGNFGRSRGNSSRGGFRGGRH